MKENIKLLFLFFLFANFAGGSDILFAGSNTSGAYNSILIVIQTRDTERETRLESIAAEVLQVELESLGFKVFLKSDGPFLETGGNLEETRSDAQNRGIDLLSICTYTVKDQDIEFVLECYDTRNPEIYASVSGSGKLNLSLDLLFSSAVEEIVALFEEQNPEKFALQRAPSEPKPLMPEEPTVVEEKIDRFYLSVGYSPFIATGKTNLYFNLGGLASFQVRYIFTTRIGDISLGLLTGLNHFSAEGAAQSSRNILLPLGFDVQYGSSMRETLSVFLHLSGGIAFVFFSPEEGEALAKTIPYMSGGVGGNLQFKRLIGLAVDISYFIFFEQYYPIMGFAPSIYLSFRF